MIFILCGKNEILSWIPDRHSRAKERTRIGKLAGWFGKPWIRIAPMLMLRYMETAYLVAISQVWHVETRKSNQH
jgi:hypothetical protein